MAGILNQHKRLSDTARSYIEAGKIVATHQAASPLPNHDTRLNVTDDLVRVKFKCNACIICQSYEAVLWTLLLRSSQK